MQGFGTAFASRDKRMPAPQAPAARLPAVAVASGILQRADGCVLLAERPEGKLSPRHWELPGGKIDPGEDPKAALIREIHEEIGVRAHRVTEWAAYRHQYPGRMLHIHALRVTEWSGVPFGREGQRLRWVSPGAPDVGPVLAAHAPALAALRLPRTCATLDLAGSDAGALLHRVAAGLAAGHRLIVVRSAGFPPGQLLQVLCRVAPLVHRAGAELLTDAGESLARRSGCDGIHTPAGHLSRVSRRPSWAKWAVTCRDATDVPRAAALGADLVIVDTPLSVPATVPVFVAGADGIAYGGS